MKSYTILVIIYLFFPLLGFVQMRTCSAVELSTSALIKSELNLNEDAVYDCAKESWRLTKWSLLAIAFVLIGGFVLMGMPGLFFMAFYELIGILSNVTQGQQTWPAAIMGSLLWPLGIPIGILVQQQMGLKNEQAFFTAYGFLLGFLAWIITAGFLLRYQSRRDSKKDQKADEAEPTETNDQQ